MTRVPLVLAFLSSAAASITLTCAAAVFAAEVEPSHFERLLEKAGAISEGLDGDRRQLPLDLEFEQTGGRLRGDVYSIVETRFESVARALGLPASWCEILPLHFNVKRPGYTFHSPTISMT